MTWFKDFDNCNYFGETLEKTLLSVGWLSKDKVFEKGVVDESDMQLIIEFCRMPLWIHVFRGVHRCELCEQKNIRERACASSGSKLFGRQGTLEQSLEEEGVFKSTSHLNIFVPYGNRIIVAPENLPHYIKEHNYKPPDEFFNALRDSPRPGSKELSSLLVKIGGNSFAERKR